MWCSPCHCAGAIGFGAFAAGGGRKLIAAALLGLALAVIGETLFAVTSYAYYAQGRAVLRCAG